MDTVIGKNKRKLTPPQILVIGFAVTILIGALLLTLPISTENGQPLPFVDALFTSTSAVCVTGLVVRDTATTFSTFGELVIITLIQVGGLGFMTFATLLAILLGKRIGVKERLVLKEAFNQLKMAGIVQLVLYVVIITFTIEGLGMVALAFQWVPQFGWEKGLYYSFFHAVSAFNNAGFDLFGDVYGKFSGLTHFVESPIVNLTITSLIILGGVGFIVIVELLQYHRTKRLSLHTKLVLSVSAILIVSGMLLIMMVEWMNPKTLGPLSFGGKILAAYFQSVSPRTAGFNTVDIAGLYPTTQFLIVILMFVGASPSSTGGGIKTTTLAAILLSVWAMVRGHDDVESFRRRIPSTQVYKALTVTAAALTLVIAVTMVLTITESHYLGRDILPALFETVSAFGTVGLTMGFTPHLTVAGKLLIAFTMFAGRLGPVTIAFAVAKRNEYRPFRYPEERPLIG
ncbi:TrkH family potassium uptake protein [Polycladomyces sp. WAk]|uniref:TrkH family potassium uptake protein n=1 Tax=Polycladomyces zharkentensis TaxID=2807616 RepID=A0ABS2WN32_9BACL|nr:TrkH family potassium uptake protein [Polycladomyces sp. WAk]MBN2910917.1 TrkH family potassium uptake protein [Polycladomyces sp. WAk]